MKQFIKEHPYISLWALGTSVTAVGMFVKNQLEKIVKKNTVLEIDFTDIIITSKPPNQSFAEMISGEAKKKMYYLDFVKLLEMAESDTKIVGIICKLGSALQFDSIITLKCIRTAILKFTKPKIIYLSEWLFGGGMIMYFLASAFTEIVSAPQNFFLIDGISATTPFLKSMMEKLNIEVHSNAQKEYKTGPNVLVEDKYTKFHREEVEALVRFINETIERDILLARVKLTTKNWRKLLQEGLCNTKVALESKIIDSVLTFDETYEKMAKEILKLKDEKSMNLLYLNYYKKKKKSELSKKLKGSAWKGRNNIIAVVHLNGTIYSGRAPSGTSDDLYGDDVADLLLAMGYIKKIKGVVLRINSGGGSSTGSEAIRLAVEKLRKVHKKKVVVSMGRVCASGGVWISVSAEKLLAEEMTITGSIGVWTLFFNITEMMKKIGITYDKVQMENQKYASTLSSIHSMTDDEKKMINVMMEEVYDDFVKMVSDERGIDIAKVKEMAKGRLHTGVGAKKWGLIDEIGGIEKAIEVCKELIGCKKEDEVFVDTYPKKNLLTAILNDMKTPKNSRDRRKKKLYGSLSSSNFTGTLLNKSKALAFVDKLFLEFSKKAKEKVSVKAKMNDFKFV